MGTHPLAGTYNNRTVFVEDTLERLGATFSSNHPSSLALTKVIGGGDEEWSVQELHGLGVCKNGEALWRPLLLPDTNGWLTCPQVSSTIIVSLG